LVIKTRNAVGGAGSRAGERGKRCAILGGSATTRNREGFFEKKVGEGIEGGSVPWGGRLFCLSREEEENSRVGA